MAKAKAKEKKRLFRKNKSYKVDFFVATHDGERKHAIIKEFLRTATNGFTPARALAGDDDEQFAISSLTALGTGVFQGVFGRYRFGETPVQGTAEGAEEDVKLKPGHGLVQKNHFLFFSNRNLIVYQRNPSGSHYSRLQRYLNLATEEQITLEPILTTDAYERLIRGGDARIIDVSFQQPKDPALYKDLWLKDAIKLMNDVGGINARVRISVGRSSSRLTRIKNAVVDLAKGGIAKVARVKLEGEEEQIDLIADRIIETITVKLYDNGRPDPEEIYATLQQAEVDRSHDLRTFFGRG